MVELFLLDASNAGSNGSNDRIGRIKENVIDALFTARLFLPGFFQRNIFLFLSLILPLVDFSTDDVNAGSGFTYMICYARLNMATFVIKLNQKLPNYQETAR